MTADEFRALATSFPEAVAGSHFDTQDFRVGGRIFATLREADGRAVLKLSADQQQLLMATTPGLFESVGGAWGQKGWTRVVLEAADPAAVRHAMAKAFSSVAPKRLRDNA